jgi:heme oxygenase
MSDTETAPIADRVDRIHQKTQRIKDLHDDVDRIVEKQKIADAKNREFEEVESKLEEVREQYEQLMEWVEYAKRMEDIEIPQSQIEDQVNTLAQDLRDLTSAEFGNFEDESDVKDELATFKGYRETLSEIAATVRGRVQSTIEIELNSVGQTLTLLEVPDIGDEDCEQTCKNYRYHLRQLKTGNLDKTSPEKWSEFANKYESLDISLDAYDLSEDSKRIIWDLLDEEEAVHLADLDAEALKDLKTFEDFSSIISLQFTTQS